MGPSSAEVPSAQQRPPTTTTPTPTPTPTKTTDTYALADQGLKVEQLAAVSPARVCTLALTLRTDVRGLVLEETIMLKIAERKKNISHNSQRDSLSVGRRCRPGLARLPYLQAWRTHLALCSRRAFKHSLFRLHDTHCGPLPHPLINLSDADGWPDKPAGARRPALAGVGETARPAAIPSCYSLSLCIISRQPWP